MAWAKNGTPETKSGAGTGLAITDLTASKLNQFLIHQLASTNVSPEYRLDSNSNTDYAWRKSGNGGTDVTTTSDNNAQIDSAGGNNDKFAVMFSCNIDSEEKLAISFLVDRNTAGAATAPNRTEGVSKVDTTTNTGQYTSIDSETGGYSIGIGSNISALASDLTPASATSIETGSIYIDTDIAGRYFYDGTNWNMQPTLEETFGSKTGWTEKDATECNIDTGNNRIHYNGDLDLTDSTVYYDVVGQLGKAFNGEKLIFRCEPKKITSANLSHRIEFRIADNFGAIADSSNAVGFYLGANNSFGGFVNENSATRTDATAFSNVSNGVAKYLEIVIDGKTVYFRTYTDNTYSIISQERTLTMTNYLPDLTYIKLGDRVTNSTTNTLEMELKNLNVWSGVTSIN